MSKSTRTFTIGEANSGAAFVTDSNGYDVAVLNRLTHTDRFPVTVCHTLDAAEWQSLIDKVGAALRPAAPPLGGTGEPDWKARFFALKDAVNRLSETSVYSSTEGCQIPTSEAWDFLERCAAHYSASGKRVVRLEGGTK